MRRYLRKLDPCGLETLHADDEREINYIVHQRGVATRRMVEVLAELCAFFARQCEPDREYVQSRDASQQSDASQPDDASQPGESQPEASQRSTESQLEQEMVDDEQREGTPQWTRSMSRSGHVRLDEPDSLKRLRAPAGSFGSPLVSDGAAASRMGDTSSSSHHVGAASSNGRRAAPPAPPPSVGRPSELAAAGAAAVQGLKEVSALAHNAPGKARALLDEHLAAAPAATSHGNIVVKSKAVTGSIFDKSGGLNEVIEVVAHVLQREEMRPILDHLGYSRAAVPLAIDSMIVESIADFVAKHVDSSFRDLGSHRGGTRSKEAQAAHSLLGKAVGSQELIDERKMKEAADRLGYRAATLRLLTEERVKMDAECGIADHHSNALRSGSRSHRSRLL